ncbi:MAG TPA: DUF2334 domain-containing protein [Verrucomicrobiae bacterium]|nr:DUF2334 domain-containing protein [Verrucomicrobiae bacterium]
MHYVILRDDDTNALTPVDCLERLYRPFLQRGLPVNLATIPEVSLKATSPDGKPEAFLFGNNGASKAATKPLVASGELVQYLVKNPGYRIVQHGLHHDCFEFDRDDRAEIRRRLQRGTDLLVKAGFPAPKAFVAPHDRFSRASLEEAAQHFPVISSGWYEKDRLPVAWWPRYLLKKISRAPHWRVGNARLLTHPGCLLSYRRPRATMLDEVKNAVRGATLVVLVTHWWEYFPERRPDEEFIEQLHGVAEFLANAPYVQVISFEDLTRPETARQIFG